MRAIPAHFVIRQGQAVFRHPALGQGLPLSPTESCESVFPDGRACHWRIPEITRRWVSETVRDSVAATDMKRSLAAPLPHRVLAAVLPSPNAHVVD
jgi:hypothetical protein